MRWETKPAEWKPYFAWHSAELEEMGSGKMVRWEWIERIVIGSGFDGGPIYYYRLPGSTWDPRDEAKSRT